MNHEIASFNASPVTDLKADSQAQDKESLLHRIISRLIRISKGFSVENQVAKHHKSYINENLLNPEIGTEISRTLRR
jgi:hypothetical protein